MRDKPSLLDGFGDGVGLALLVVAVIGWAVVAQAFLEPPIKLPRADVIMVRP